MITYNPNEVRFGATRPEQASSAAALIYDTDPVLWDCLFSNDAHSAIRFFEQEWHTDESAFSYSLCTGALLDSELIGIELGFDKSTNRSGTGRCGIKSLHPEILKHFSENIGYITYLIPPIPKGVYYIQYLSVAPWVRGQGLGQRLLGNAFIRAKQEGYMACQLDVSSDNQAVKFYLQMGMEILSESRVLKLEEHGVHSHYRMVKTL